MRILQVGSGFSAWGGAERHLLSLAAEQRRRGHEVVVAAQPEGFLATEALRLGLTVAPLIVRRQADWGAFPKALALIRDLRPEVVHVHTSQDYLIPAVAARVARVPRILMTRHVPYPLKPHAAWLYGGRLFDRIPCDSESVRQMILSCGVSPERAVTVHNGAAQPIPVESPEAVRRAWSVPADAVVVGFFGRFIPDKGWRTLAEAMRHCPTLHALFVGDGKEQEEAVQTYTSERVRFTGFQSLTADLMNAVDIVVLPSVWAEPCATVVSEAMALGRPVIGTRIGGTPELIVENETGLLVPPGDVAALTVALNTLAADSVLRLRFGQAGKQRYAAHFTVAAMAKKVEEVYNSIS